MIASREQGAADLALMNGHPLTIELRHLRYFLLVAEEQHFGRAAVRAGIDQSPFSRQILDLENRLGVKLLNRTRRRTTLTPEGHQFAVDIRRMLVDLQTSIAVVRSMVSGVGVPFRLGLAEGAAGPAFGRLLTACSNHEPPINLVLVERPGDDLFDLMLTAGLDGAITLHPPAAIEGLNAVCAWHHTMMVAAAPGHWTGERDSISLSELRDETWVLPDPKSQPGYAAQQEAILRSQDVPLDRVVRAGHQNSLLQLIGADRGIGFVPEGLAGLAVDLNVTPIIDPAADVVSWFVSPVNASPLLSGVREEIERIARHGVKPCSCEHD